MRGLAHHSGAAAKVGARVLQVRNPGCIARSDALDVRLLRADADARSEVLIGSISTSRGSISRQAAMACGQRV